MEDELPITYIGKVDHRNKMTKFGIKPKDRTKHMYVIGKTGTGKSTFLENMIVQDIQNGHGVAFIDPHGGSAEKLLDYIPEWRVNDVIYFNPSDMEFPVAFNPLEDPGPEKRHLVTDGLMSVFKKIWPEAFSGRMEYILNMTMMALMEYPDSTVLSINRMLTDKDFRKKVIASVTDSAVRNAWEELMKWDDKRWSEAIGALVNKVGQFSTNPVIRNIIGQSKSTFDFRRAMDERKIIIINLSKGQIGEQNAPLLGAMLITKIYLAAMSRAELPGHVIAKTPPFYFYVDEFQNFANESFASILSEARKYKLCLTVANQFIAQMEETIRDAVFGNMGSIVAFRIGPLDAEFMEKVFAPIFTQEDLQNIAMFQMYLTLQIDNLGSKPFSARALEPIPPLRTSMRDMVIDHSRSNFARTRTDVEESVREFFGYKKEIPKVISSDTLVVPRPPQLTSVGSHDGRPNQPGELRVPKPPVRPGSVSAPTLQAARPAYKKPDTPQPSRIPSSGGISRPQPQSDRQPDRQQDRQNVSRNDGRPRGRPSPTGASADMSPVRKPLLAISGFKKDQVRSQQSGVSMSAPKVQTSDSLKSLIDRLDDVAIIEEKQGAPKEKAAVAMAPAPVVRPAPAAAPVAPVTVKPDPKLTRAATPERKSALQEALARAMAEKAQPQAAPKAEPEAMPDPVVPAEFITHSEPVAAVAAEPVLPVAEPIFTPEVKVPELVSEPAQAPEPLAEKVAEEIPHIETASPEPVPIAVKPERAPSYSAYSGKTREVPEDILRSVLD